MDARDLYTLMRLDDQILGVAGEDLLLPESGEKVLRHLIDRALRLQTAESCRHAFDHFWRDARIRRQPWERGVRSYIGWRLYGDLERLTAASLATDLAGDEVLALALGRDEHGVWVPERCARTITTDLELDPNGGSPLVAHLGLAPGGSSAAMLRHLLTGICGAEPSSVTIESPAYWSLVHGWLLPDAGGEHMPLLTDAYCRRVTTVTTRLRAGGCPLGETTTLVPPRSEWDAIPELRQAIDTFDTMADLDAVADLLHAIPPTHRGILLAGARPRPLVEALRGLLFSLVGRHLLTGVFSVPEFHTASFLQRPLPPFEQAAVTSLADSRLAISAGIISSALTWCGVLPETPGNGIGGHHTSSYPWSTLTGSMGLGDLLRQAWPERVQMTESDGTPFPGEWLILPPHHAEVLAETLRRTDEVNSMTALENQ